MWHVTGTVTGTNTCIHSWEWVSTSTGTGMVGWDGRLVEKVGGGSGTVDERYNGTMDARWIG